MLFKIKAKYIILAILNLTYIIYGTISFSILCLEMVPTSGGSKSPCKWSDNYKYTFFTLFLKIYLNMRFYFNIGERGFYIPLLGATFERASLSR